MDILENLNLEDVSQLVARVLGVDVSVIRDELSYQSIHEWDSFRHISLISELEKQYNVEIGEEKVMELISVLEIKNFLRKLFGEEQENIATPQKLQNSKEQETKIHRGLNGVYFDYTKITSIDGQC